jgi:hypothetical protein
VTVRPAGCGTGCLRRSASPAMKSRGVTSRSRSAGTRCARCAAAASPAPPTVEVTSSQTPATRCR